MLNREAAVDALSQPPMRLLKIFLNIAYLLLSWGQILYDVTTTLRLRQVYLSLEWLVTCCLSPLSLSLCGPSGHEPEGGEGGDEGSLKVTPLNWHTWIERPRLMACSSRSRKSFKSF